MKKRIISLILVITILLCSNVFAITVFSDVSFNHWAIEYIYEAQYKKIINGYEDGTFKPENQVKTGEFIKMITMAMWPNYKNVAPKEGEHWAKPYADALDRIVLMTADYDFERLERVITRKEAARLLSLFYIKYNDGYKLDSKYEYIQNFKDEALVTEEIERICIDDCVRFGLINGFEDGTFRPNDGLTRAQAAKILCIAISEN